MKKVLVVLLTIIILIAGYFFLEYNRKPPEIQEPEDLEYGEIVYVIDGDTMVLQKEDGSQVRIRLIGIDAPESANHQEDLNTEEGKEATEYVRKELENQEVWVEYDVELQDKYGRTLVYLWKDGELINRKILDAGHAKLMTIPPNTKYKEYLEAYEVYPKEG